MSATIWERRQEMQKQREADQDNLWHILMFLFGAFVVGFGLFAFKHCEAQSEPLEKFEECPPVQVVPYEVQPEDYLGRA